MSPCMEIIHENWRGGGRYGQGDAISYYIGMYMYVDKIIINIVIFSPARESYLLSQMRE